MKFLDLFAGIGFARKSYKAIHDTRGEIELHDITTVSDESIRRIGRVDIICGGFPCQAFSIAGARRGFKDTRGTLFFEIARFASILKPKLLFLENVKGLLNHDKGNTFKTIIGALDELGMMWNGKCLTAKILESHRIGSVCSLSDILEENVPETFFLSAEKVSQLVVNR